MALLDAIADFDESVLRAINGLAGSSFAFDAAMVAITAFGMSYILVLIFFPLWLSRRRALAIDVLVVVLLSIACEMALKALVARERPFMVLDDLNSSQVGILDTASGYSFPSGHATRAFAVGVLLWLSLKGTLRHMIPCGAALVAVSRVYLGLHWPTDVIAGALLGTSLALAVYAVGKRSSGYAAARAKLTSHIEKATSWLSHRT